MPGRQEPRNMVAADRDKHRSQNERKAAREKPGCERGLLASVAGRLGPEGRQPGAGQIF